VQVTSYTMVYLVAGIVVGLIAGIAIAMILKRTQKSK